MCNVQKKLINKSTLLSFTFWSGKLKRNSLSKRPGLLSAGSIESSLFVAPITTISPLLSSPSMRARRVDTMELKESFQKKIIGNTVSNSNIYSFKNMLNWNKPHNCFKSQINKGSFDLICIRFSITTPVRTTNSNFLLYIFWGVRTQQTICCVS